MNEPQFAASIFDMDGLLVDSERLWHLAEIQILGDLGVPMRPESCRQTKGMFVNEAIGYWFARFPWPGPSVETVSDEVVDRVMELVLSEGELMPGALHAVDECARRGLPMAVASSSQYRLIELVLGHFDLTRHFGVVHSAEDEPYGKPHPGVFLTTAQRLDVAAERCVVWEDSPAGVLAAKAARMACVAVPEEAERDHRMFGIADVVLSSLEQLDDGVWDRVVARHWADPMAAPTDG